LFSGQEPVWERQTDIRTGIYTYKLVGDVARDAADTQMDTATDTLSDNNGRL